MVSQVELIAAIAKHLDSKGVKDVLPRQMNAIIKAADGIIRELERPFRQADEGAGLDSWLASDDTGLSSVFMASVLGGFSRPYAHPYDPGDFGRCVRLLSAVPEFRPRIADMASASPEWKRLVESWDELERLYLEELPTGRAPRCYSLIKKCLDTANTEVAPC